MMLREFSLDLIHWIAHLLLIFCCLSEEQNFWKSSVHAYDNTICRWSSSATSLNYKCDHQLALCAAALIHNKTWTVKEKKYKTSHSESNFLQFPLGGGGGGGGVGAYHSLTGNTFQGTLCHRIVTMEVEWTWNKWPPWYVMLYKGMLSYFMEKIRIRYWCCAKTCFQLCPVKAVSRQAVLFKGQVLELSTMNYQF